MSSSIKLKRSSVQGKKPTISDLQLGEVAINTHDGKMYIKKDNGTESIVQIGITGYTTGNVNFSNTSPNQLVDSFGVNAHRTVKYLVELSTPTAYQASEIFLTHNGTSVFTTEYATVNTSASLGTLDSNIANSLVKLLVSPINSNTTVKFARFEVNAANGGGGSGGGLSLTDLSVTTGSASGGGSLSYNNSTGVFTYAPAVSSFTNQYTLTGTTSNTTETEILVGGSTRIPVPSNTTVYYTADIVCRRTDATGDHAAFYVKGVATNANGTVSDVGNLYEVVVARTDPNILVDIRADDTNNSVNVYVTGLNAKTFSWKASVSTLEI